MPHDQYNIQLDTHQKAALVRMAKIRGCSLAVLIREGIESITGVPSRIKVAGRPKSG